MTSPDVGERTISLDEKDEVLVVELAPTTAPCFE